MTTKEYTTIGIVTLFALLSVAFVFADPAAPTSLTEGYTSNFVEGNYGPQSTEAIAGNITALVLYGIGQTRAWQGYYGNISATITLDDALNYTFYNWSETEPQGEIYATLNDSITWDNVGCYNFSADGGYDFANETSIEDYYSIQYDDADGVAETYTATNHPNFQIGPRTISGCPTAYIFQNDTRQTANFVNVLLYDNTSAINQTGWVYTAMLENKTTDSSNDLQCYNFQECDFQILVNEDGHATDTQTTTYYFWVELT